MKHLEEKKRSYWELYEIGSFFDKISDQGRCAIDIINSGDTECIENIGISRMGGQPDLPNDIEWPYSGSGDKYHPMAFVAQLNLDAISNSFVEYTDHLPTHGMLYFFRNASDSIGNYGYSLEDFEHCKVIHYTGPKDALQKRPFPKELEKHERYLPREVFFLNDFSLPAAYDSPWNICWEEVINAIVELDEDFDEDEFYDSLYEVGDINGRDAQILGHPPCIVSSVENDVAALLNDKRASLEANIPDTLREKIATPFGRTPEEWRSLLTVTSIEECEMLWGDCGNIYFMITEDDLKASRFDRIICILQSS